MKNNKNKKVVVAMSGGVDSSVAAALLQRAGFDIVGVFMKLWNRRCPSQVQKRASKVAQILGIPFYVFNFEKEFKKRIIDYFLAEYKAGRTPNPCVVCNKEIKFGLLLEKTLALGADFIATGHYVRKRYSFVRSDKTVTKNLGNYQLLKAKDKTKDQSYFLWRLGQKELKHILFPVGDYTKKEVKELAKKFKLPLSEMKESQEVCFIQKTTEDFLKKYLKEKPGRIATKDSEVVGEHQGLWFYTIGQRKRIGLSGGPYYVLGKDKKRNVLIVTKNEKDLEKKDLIAKDVNWISDEPPKLPLRIKAKIRYRSPSVSAMITQPSHSEASRPKNLYKVVFSRPQRAVTPGQSVVFYQREELLGGGIIA